MPTPRTAADVLICAKEAITTGRFFPAVHFGKRMAERRVDMTDIHTAIDRSHQAEPYKDGKARHGGACWRVIGPDCDGEGVLAIGIEVFTELDGSCWIVLCTVMDQ